LPLSPLARSGILGSSPVDPPDLKIQSPHLPGNASGPHCDIASPLLRQTDSAHTSPPSVPAVPSILAHFPPLRCTTLPLLPPASPSSPHPQCRPGCFRSVA